MTPELWVAGALLAALMLYVITGGADFGGGVWDLLATGPRAARQRALIAQAIAPIWEANHVWLILVIVLLFVCFPPAFVRLSITLHVPLSLMLLGIVMRGSAFVFRAHSGRDGMQPMWSGVFAIASLVTPVTFGMCVGALASGALAEPATPMSARDLIAPWTRPFPVVVGLLTLALFAFLAATYLTRETEDRELVEDFRLRALLSGALAIALALVALMLARHGAPRLFEGLMRSSATPAALGATLAAAIALWSLWTRRLGVARVAAAAFAALLIGGWAIAQYPFLIEPDITITEAARPARAVLPAVLICLGFGAVVLVPSVIYLFAVFKKARCYGTTPRQGTPE